MPRNNRQTAIERHPDRSEIEASLCRRVPLRKLSARYGLDIATLSRHHAKLRQERPKTYQALQASDWSTTPAELERIRVEAREGYVVKVRSQIDKLVAAQDEAFETERYGSGAQIAGQVHAALRLLGEFTGGLSDGSTRINVSTTNIQYNAEFQTLRDKIFQALRPHPDALRAVIAALRADAEPAADAGSKMITLSSDEVIAS